MTTPRRFACILYHGQLRCETKLALQASRPSARPASATPLATGRPGLRPESLKARSTAWSYAAPKTSPPISAIAEGEERSAMRERGEAYGYTDTEGARHVWHPGASEGVASRFDTLREAKAVGTFSASPTAAGVFARSHCSPESRNGDKGGDGSSAQRPPWRRR